MKYELYTKKYPQEGDLQHSYSPLKNVLNGDNKIVDFDTDELNVDLTKPLTIDCQADYDGSVNLIINDDVNPPRIINSRFTKTEDNRFRTINRNQFNQTNLYKEGKIDRQTRLFRNTSLIPKFSFMGLDYQGCLKGGNYTFYVKYSDEDYNKTDIVCESGQISIFKGTLDNIKSVSGTLQDEVTDKSIKLLISNIDLSFSKIYLYYTREYSDLNGFRLSETVLITKPYEIVDSEIKITINGYEQTTLVSDSELNITYNYVSNVKTQAQVQNMLFFGNIENINVDVKNLQNISYFFKVTLKQKETSIGWINPDTYSTPDTTESLEYYDPKNIYYYLGYWPEEIYRLGVVYIMNDDSLSPVFNLRGCELKKLDDDNWDESIKYKIKNDSDELVVNYLERDAFISPSSKSFINTFGVFKNPSETENSVIQDHINNEVKPWYYQIELPTEENWDYISELKELGVKGFFFVRQKRIPTILTQGISLGIDSSCGIPLLYDFEEKKYFTERFLDKDGKLSKTFKSRKAYVSDSNGSAIISVEASSNPILQSTLDGNSFMLQKVRTNASLKGVDRHHVVSFNSNELWNTYRIAQCVYMNSDTSYKYVNGYGFSSKAGSAESVKEFGILKTDSEDIYDKDNRDLVRGIYSPYIAVCSNLDPCALYNIKINNYSSNYIKDYFTIRRDDDSPFYSISDRITLDDSNRIYDVYRGDCFTNTVTVRLNRNFIDPDYPINDTIIDSETWKNHYNGFYNTTLNDKDAEKDETLKPGEPDGNWAKINRGDLNAVPMGMWITYKCLSNRNLGLRAEDRSYPDEIALMGNPRSFYPLQDFNTRSNARIPESFVLNDGYSATVGQKTHISAPNVPYIKDQFDNRIMFSNIQVDGDFKNGYRVFQGLSYEDIDRQYGAIVKLIPWGVNLFCVFEHGLGIIPINEKALMQTTTEQSIHLYGTGVLQKQISLITPDYGSIWPESVIRTPIGIYGVDTYAKKIWRYTDSNGFETISDMKIQRFLNDNIKLNESDKYPIIALKNVKSHYNNYKGDVMFTFYNFAEGKEWNFCYNERMSKWITRYSWTPLYSENINNIFYSLDKKRAEILAHIYDNKHCTYGIKTKGEDNVWKVESKISENGDEYNELTDVFELPVELTGVYMASKFDLTLDSLETSYIDNGREVYISKDSNWLNSSISETEFIKIENDLNNPLLKVIKWNRTIMESLLKDVWVNDSFPYKAPLYYKLGVTIQPYIKIGGSEAKTANIIRKTIGVVVDYKYAPTEYDDLLCNGFYVHGRAGIFNEIDYEDDNENNQIKPTYWYNKQEPFEFEFVVNEPVGLHKIFDNLVIISNKAKPNSIEIEVIGDVYNFKKSGLLKDTKFKNTTINYDPILNQKTLITEQECKDMEKVGRRMGNIHYKEDSWYLTVEPIKFKNNNDSAWSSTRIRDKFAKVRVKYSGEDTVIITAIKTLLNLTTS